MNRILANFHCCDISLPTHLFNYIPMFFIFLVDCSLIFVFLLHKFTLNNEKQVNCGVGTELFSSGFGPKVNIVEKNNSLCCYHFTVKKTTQQLSSIQRSAKTSFSTLATLVCVKFKKDNYCYLIYSLQFVKKRVRVN